MQIRLRFAMAGMVLAISLTACGTSSPPPFIPPVLQSIVLVPANPSIAQGTTVQLSARGKYSNGSTADITATALWDSSDPTIASVSNAAGSRGLVMASGPTGTVLITASLSGIKGSTVFTSSLVSSITVSTANAASIAPGTAKQFTATGTLQDSATQDLTTFATWAAQDPSVVLVSDTAGSKGLATALIAPGATTIEATYGGVTGTAPFTSSHVSTITTSPASASIAKGLSQQFTADALLVDTSPQNLTSYATWTSSNTAVGTFDNLSGPRGLLSSVNTGTTFVTAGFDSIVSSPSSTCVVTPAVITSIAVTPASSSIPLGKTKQYKAMGTFTDKSVQDITASATWTSSNSAVAVVSNTAGSKGLATSKAEGSTFITASLSGKTSNSATLTVTPPQLVSLLVTPVTAKIIINNNIFNPTQQFNATGTFTDGSLQDITTSVTWISSDISVATISNVVGSQGLATANRSLPSSGTFTTNITASGSGLTSNTAVLSVSQFGP